MSQPLSQAAVRFYVYIKNTVLDLTGTVIIMYEYVISGITDEFVFPIRWQATVLRCHSLLANLLNC